MPFYWQLPRYYRGTTAMLRTSLALLADISGDLRTDGTLDDSSLGSALINNAIYLSVGNIRENITDRY